MIDIKQWMELVDYRITEGSTYGWACYGENVYTLDSWNGDNDKGHGLHIIFNTDTQEVFEVQVHDYKNERAYRLINPDYLKNYNDEANGRGVDANEAWEDVEYVTLDTDEDFLFKAEAIINDEDYDTRVDMPLELNDELWFKLMKLAHERNITLNELVSELLTTLVAMHTDKKHDAGWVWPRVK